MLGPGPQLAEEMAELHGIHLSWRQALHDCLSATVVLVEGTENIACYDGAIGDEFALTWLERLQERYLLKECMPASVFRLALDTLPMNVNIGTLNIHGIAGTDDEQTEEEEQEGSGGFEAAASPVIGGPEAADDVEARIVRGLRPPSFPTGKGEGAICAGSSSLSRHLFGRRHCRSNSHWSLQC